MLDDYGLTGPPESGGMPGAADSLTPLPNDHPFETEPVKLSAEQLAQVWRRVEGGQQYAKREFHPTYHAACRIWSGKYYDPGRGRDHLVINVIPGLIRQLVEAVSYSYPKFLVKPRSQAGQDTEAIATAVLDYYWGAAHIQPELKRACYDKALFGVGVVMTGWLFSTQTTTRNESRLEVLPPGMPATGAAMAEEAGLLDEDETAEDFVPAEDVVDDRPMVRRINPMDFLVPPSAGDQPDDWEWCCRIERRPLAEVKRDPQFKNTRGLKGETKLVEADMSPSVREMAEDRRPPDVRYVTLLHYYERHRRLLVTLCAENKAKALRVIKWPWPGRSYPFLSTHGPRLPGQFYGKSMVCELEDQAIELAECRTQLMEHRRQFNRMFQTPEGALDSKNKNLLYKGEAGTVVEWKNVGAANPVQPIQHPQLQPEVYKSYEWSLAGMQMVAGLDSYSAHDPPTKRMSATEATSVAAAGGIIGQADAQEFRTLCERTAEWVLALCEQYSQVVQELPIYTSDESPQVWHPFTGADIRGAYDVSVYIGSTEPPSIKNELGQETAILQVLVQAGQLAAQSGGQLPRPITLVMRSILRLLGERNADELLPLPPAMPPGPLLPAGAPQGPAGGLPGPGLPSGPQPALPPAGGPAVGLPGAPDLQAQLGAMSPEELTYIAQLLQQGS